MITDSRLEELCEPAPVLTSAEALEIGAALRLAKAADRVDRELRDTIDLRRDSLQYATGYLRAKSEHEAALKEWRAL